MMGSAPFGTAQDYVVPLMWFNLEAAQLTPQQIAEAERLARAWRPTKWRRGRPHLLLYLDAREETSDQVLSEIAARLSNRRKRPSR